MSTAIRTTTVIGPTIMVRGLSDGFDDEAMVAHIAKPHLTALGAQIVWPVAVATPSGSTMMIRETTDRQSPLALEQYRAGVRVPMLGSAAGRAYLAYCAGPQRDALLELLSRSPLPEDRLARSRVEVERLLNETRTQGFRHGASRSARLRRNQSRHPGAGERPDTGHRHGSICRHGGAAADGG